MIKDDIRSILKTLLERSNAKQVSWTPFEGPSALENDDYIVSFPKSSVNVYKDSKGIIYASILNGSGAVVGSISSGDELSDAALLEELLDSARESVFRVDETLEDIRRALANKTAVGIHASAPAAEDDIAF